MSHRFTYVIFTCRYEYLNKHLSSYNKIYYNTILVYNLVIQKILFFLHIFSILCISNFLKKCTFSINRTVQVVSVYIFIFCIYYYMYIVHDLVTITVCISFFFYFLYYVFRFVYRRTHFSINKTNQVVKCLLFLFIVLCMY